MSAVQTELSKVADGDGDKLSKKIVSLFIFLDEPCDDEIFRFASQVSQIATKTCLLAASLLARRGMHTV